MKSIKTKNVLAIAMALLLVAALAAGCGKKQPNAVVDWQLTDPYEVPSDYTSPWELNTTETEPPAGTTEDASSDATAPGVITSIVYIYPDQTTRAPATAAPGGNPTNPSATRPPVTNPPASAAATTTRTTTRTTTTTTTTRTTTSTQGTTRVYANPITITGKDGALSAFNSAVQRVISGKAGFGKSHMVTYKDWSYDPALLEGIPTAGLGNIFDPETYITSSLNAALSKGVRSATQHKGDSTILMKNPTWTMNDLKDVTYSGTTGGTWTITVTVKDGATRQEKRLFGSGTSGDSPIDRGPLNMATGDGSLYDHNRADQVFSLVKSQLAFINADPIDISENTTQVRFVAVLDGGGSFISLTATYNQQINLAEIKILNGAQSYKNNVGSASVTVTYDEFDY